MTQTQQEFNQQKENAKDKLLALQSFLQKGDELGVNVKQSLEKVEIARQKVAQRKLKVALIGGFSEGKTSIVAAWLGESKDNMKISRAESSDEVVIYDVNGNDEIEIIDTPGLFGFKEKGIGADKEKYKDMTKKFVSEADIVLYVMNPKNPIKESHKEDLEWLFKTLNLLPRTIFVLSKFDEVADMEDKEEFNEAFKIKKEESIIPRLQSLIKLNDDEIKNLQIVAVSANPFNKGLESYWLKAENKEQFKELSHIESLQSATTTSIQQNGGFELIITQAQTSIISDVLHKELPIALNTKEKITKDARKLKESQEALQKAMSRTEEQIRKARINLRAFITKYFNNLIAQLQGTSLETFNDFMQEEIGSEGSLMIMEVKNKFEEHCGMIRIELEKSLARFDAEMGDFEKAISSYGKQGIAVLQKSGVINATNVKLARDVIKTGLETIGINVGKMLNFKPWGAVNFAKGANTAVAVIGLALEAWDSYKQMEREQKFQEAKANIKEMLENQMKGILETIDDDSKFLELFQGYKQLENALNATHQNLEKIEFFDKEFNEWVEQGKVLAIEYKP